MRLFFFWEVTDAEDSGELHVDKKDDARELINVFA